MTQQFIVRISQFVFLVLISSITLFCIRQAKIRTPSIRKLAALEAIDDAIGRAIETARPIHFTVGWGWGGLYTADGPQIIAGLSVLSRVAEQVAKMNGRLIATFPQPEVIPIAEETVRQAYASQNRPDLYKDDTVRFVSPLQYSYVSGVIGLLLRERPAANILIGPYWSEALMFAEVGNTVGAIQIAGTAKSAQIPFFVAACDYCLIGEEIFAAGAYVSKDPTQLGTIVAQDWSRLIMIGLILLGSVLAMIKVDWLTQFLKM